MSLEIATKDLEYDRKYFPSTYHPNNYFTPSYWPATGAEPRGGVGAGYLPLAVQIEVEKEEKESRRRKWMGFLGLIIAEI